MGSRALKYCFKGTINRDILGVLGFRVDTMDAGFESGFQKNVAWIGV